VISRSPVLIVGAVGIAALALWMTRQGVKQFEKEVSRAAVETGVPSPSPVLGKQPSPAPLPVAASVKSEAFAKLAGRWLENSAELVRGPDGQLVSFRQRGGSRAPGAYDPLDKKQILTRARDFLRDAREALALAPDTELLDESVRADSHQGDVFLRQSYQGIPLGPVGAATLTLGPQGELRSFSGDLLSGAWAVTGAFKLTAEAASRMALASVAGAESHQSRGGTRRIWIVAREDGTVEGRPSYEFMVQGRRVVVDAQTGEILLRRDRRIY
jgi:hypothetical protein